MAAELLEPAAVGVGAVIIIPGEGLGLGAWNRGSALVRAGGAGARVAFWFKLAEWHRGSTLAQAGCVKPG